MRRLVVPAILSAMLCVAGAAQAETAPVGKPIDVDSQIGRYILSRPMLAEAHKLAVAQDRTFGVNCEGQYSIQPQTISVLQPIEMSDGGERPASGAWRLGYAAQRCGTAKRFNALYIVRDGGVPSAQALVPGATIAGVQLMIDTIKIAAPALLAVAKDCKDLRVADTRLAQPVTQLGVPWREEWQFLRCGETIDVPINFVPTADGGTDIQVRAPTR